MSWLQRYELRDDEPRAPGRGAGDGDEEPLLPAHLRTGTTLLGPGEHPFPTRYANRSMRVRIEPSIYLDALVRDVVAFGGRIVIALGDRPSVAARVRGSCFADSPPSGRVMELRYPANRWLVRTNCHPQMRLVASTRSIPACAGKPSAGSTTVVPSTVDPRCAGCRRR